VASKQRKKKTRATQRQRVKPDSNPSDFAWLGKRIHIFGITTIFLLHVLGLGLLFSPLVASINGEPIIDQDWGLHFHHLRSLEAFWRQDKALWGYNPFFMAGYPSNTIQDLSIKFFELLSLVLATIVLSPVQWFKIGAFLAMAGVPWILYLAARNFFFDNDSKNLTGTAAALLGTVYWWNSLPREMFFYGMIGFPVASYLSILGVSLFYRIAKQARSFGPVHFGLLIFALAILPLHVQSLVIFLPPVIALLVIEPRLLSVRIAASVIAVLALSLLLNAAWLIPAITHRGDDISDQIVRQLPLFASSDPLTFLKDYLGPVGYWTFRPAFLEKGFRVALLVVGVFGTWKLIQSDNHDLGMTLASALTGLFLITYFGGLTPFTGSWQPLRFKVPLDLFLVIGAAYGATQWLTTPRTPRSSTVPILLGCGLVAFLFNLVQTESTGRLQLRSRLIPELNAVIDWIKRETPANARVLFEESGDESGFVYDRTYLSAFLPHLTGRQLIGGPINLYNDRHHFAEFHSGKIFKKDSQSLSDDQLRGYLRLYNIGAVVAFDPASIRRLQSIPGLVTIDQRIGPVHLMKVNQPLSWFMEGEGEVQAGFNRLELSHLKGQVVILKYHWIEGLTGNSAIKIEPVRMLDDPIPFIKLINPPPAVTLRIHP
jgi:hypothetical protein